MGQQAQARTADSKGLAAIGVSLGLAALFATMMAAFLVTAEVQALSSPQQQAALGTVQR